MVNNRYYKHHASGVRIIFLFLFISLLSLSLFTVGSEAATYYVQPDNTTNVGIDGTCNLASGQATTAPTVRTTFDPASNGATGSSYRPNIGMSNGNWTVLMRVYGPVYSTNAVDISAVTAAKFSIRGYNSTDQWTFNLYDYNPAGTAGNKTLVATSQTITSGTGGTVAVNPTYTISGTGRVQQNHRLLLEIAYRPGGTTYTPRVYYDTTGTTTESYVTVTETPVAAGDTLTASGNTAITLTNPVDGTAGILMQRFQVSSNNVQNGQIQLTSLNLTDNGNATSILDAKVYISATSSSTLPVGAVLIGNTGAWNGNATVVTLNGGTVADRTVTTGTPKFIYIVYDLTAGQTGNTIQSNVTAAGVASPDTGAGNVGTSSVLTVQPCSDPTPSSITLPAIQTAYGDPYDVSGMYSTTGNPGAFEYKITTGGGPGIVTRAGSWVSTVDTNPTSYTVTAGTDRVLIVAVGIENSSGTISVSGVTFGGQPVTPIAQIGDGGTGYNNYVWFGYCNEACITAAGVGAQNIQVTSNATLNNIIISAGTYENVDQASPAYASGTNSTTSSPISTNVNNPDGGRVLFGVNFNGQTNSLNTLSGYTEMFDTPTDTAGAGNGFSFAVAERNLTSAATPENITATASAASSRTNIVAVSLNPGAGETICSSPEWTTNPLVPASGTACDPYVTTPDNYNLYVRATDPDCGTQVISSPSFQAFTWNSDGTAPTVTSFTATTPSTSLNIPLTSFTASDNIAVTGYMITTSSTAPLAGDGGWTGTAPATYTIGSDGTYTLYPWAKDAAGNVSAVFATPRTVLVDTTAPTVSSTIPTNGTTSVALNSSVTINWSENVNCSTVNTINITSSNPAWSLSSCSSNQAVFTVGGQSYSSLYSVTVAAAVTDANGNPMAGNHVISYTTAAQPNDQVIVTDGTDPAGTIAYANDTAIVIDSFTMATNANTAQVTEVAASMTNPSNIARAMLYRDAGTIIGALDGADVLLAADNSPNSVNLNGFTESITTTPSNYLIVVDIANNPTPGQTVTAAVSGLIITSPDIQGTITDTGATITIGSSDLTAPSSAVTTPANGALINSASANPFTISGSATDNIAVSGIEISTNGGSTWNAATCSGCPGANVTWTYSWTLPADGSYTIRSRATDSSSNVETPGAGNTVTMDRTAPAVSSTIPANGATGVALNSSVTINWSEDVNCATVTTASITSSSTGWALSGCSNNQAVFTTSGQSGLTTYIVTVTTAVLDTYNNPMSANSVFTYTTADVTPPASTILTPANGSSINSSSPNPYSVSGSASDNLSVSGIEVSTNGGSTWNPATCTGCPGANVTWTYTWTLPADGTYTVRSRAKDTSNNTELPGAGNTVTIDRTPPSVSTTSPVNGAMDVVLNSSVTITWSENINCSTVDPASITSTNPVWNLLTCSGNQAIFTTAGQAGLTIYSVTITTGVRDTMGNAMTSGYSFSYTTETPPNGVPSAPTGLAQYRSDETTVISQGKWTNENIIIMKGTITDPDGDLVQLQVEIQPEASAFTGIPNCTSGPAVASNSIAKATCTGLANGTRYKWQARSLDDLNTPSSWIAYGTTDPDISIDTTAPAYTWNAPAPGDYFKNGSAISVDAAITETGSGLLNGTDCNAKIDGSSAGFTGIVIYYPATGKCTGTLTLNNPSGLINGAHNLTIQAPDIAGNSIESLVRTINIDNNVPVSTVSAPANGSVINSGSPNPYTISGTASDNAVVSRIEVSTNGGTTWNTAACTGCGTNNAAWMYSWTLPSDGIYNIKSRAADSANNIEMPGAGNSVTVDRTSPAVSVIQPSNGATGTALNGSVTITWNENIDCTTVTTSNVTISSGGWTVSECSANQAVFTTGSQTYVTSYTVTVGTAVKDLAGNSMAANYIFSYTTSGMDMPDLTYPSSPYDNGLDPDTGDTRTTFTFMVIYRDYENDAPAPGYPMIFIGDNDGYYGYTMTPENPADSNYTDGRTYYFTTGFGAAQDLRYFFEAQAATGNTNAVTLPSSAPGYKTGPSVYLLPGYNLVGVPKNLSCNCNTYTNVLGDDSGYQYCLYWDSYGPDPAGGGWTDNTYGMLYSGRGYDIYSDGGARRLDEPAGAAPMGNEPGPYVDIVLDCQSGSCNPAVSGNGGWSVISNPYNAFIELRDVMVVRGGTEYSYTQAVANGWISNSIYEWEGDGPGYAFKAFNGSQPAVLEPWVGYFIHVFDTVPTTLRVYAP